MFARVPIALSAPTTSALLTRPRDHCSVGTAVRLRRRRNVKVSAVLTPEKEEISAGEKGKGSRTVKKIFKFLRSLQDDEQEAAEGHVNGNGNGNGSAATLPVKPVSPTHAEEPKPFFATWTERSPTDEEAQVLREKLSPQAGGWDNWGGEEPGASQQGGEAVANATLPSRAFLGIEESERVLRPVDTWDPVVKAFNRGSEPLWTRPEWFPQFFDPFDRTSDMRRWIIPYVLVPYLVSQSIRVIVLEPLFEDQLEMRNPIFKLKAEQEMHVEHEVSAFKNHLQFEQLLGRAPPLSDTEMQATLRKKALDLEREEREHNCAALANFVTDSTFAIILVANLLLQLEEAEKLRKTLSKEFFSLDSSRQAFILLLVSDILVGYHSAEGWSTGLEGIGHHYGLDERKDLIAIFVAIVPVAMDVLFKFWVFKYLRNYSPDTQVILEEIDRH